MKKLSTLFLAIFAVMAVNAELLMHETFPTPGQLDAGLCIYNATKNPVKIDTIAGYQSMWWAWNTPWDPTAAKPGYLWTQVVAEHAMSYPGYASNAVGGAMHLTYDANETTTSNHYSTNDLHYFAPVAPVAGNRVYVSFLMNPEEFCYSGMSATGEVPGSVRQIVTLSTDSSTATGVNFGYLSLFLNPNNPGTFKFIVDKSSSDATYPTIVKKEVVYKTRNFYNQTPADYYHLTGFVSQEYNVNETYLVVLEYIFEDNASLQNGQVGNDSVNVYINPTLNNKVPTVHSVGYNAVNTSTQAITWFGRYKNADPTKPLRIVKFWSAKPLQSVYYDQIKVATAWEDLFEGSVDDAAIDVNTHEITKYVVSGGSFSDSIVVTAHNLEDDLTIEPADENTKLEVVDDEFDADDEELATGVTVHFSAENLTENGTDTLLVYSADVVQKVAINWVVISSVSTLAEVQDTVYYTGNAQVTYNADIYAGARMVTIQDETGAIAVDQLDGFAVGDVVTNLVLLGSKKAAVQTAHPGVVYTVSSAEHSEVAYSVTPEVVTVANLSLANHLYKLVKVESVSVQDNQFLDNRARNEIGSNTYVLTPSGNALVGQTAPAHVDVVGVFNGIAQTLLDPSSAVWKYICPRGLDDVTEAIVAPTKSLAFAESTIHIETTMYVGEVYTSILPLTGENLTDSVVLVAEGVTLGSYKMSADTVNGEAEVTITIAPTEVNAAWTGSITATCGELTATVTFTGVVERNTATAVDNVATKVKTVKVIKNGQIRIVRGENEFSVLGEQVK